MHVEEHTIDVAGVPVFYRSAAIEPGGPRGQERAPSAVTVLYLHGVPTSSDDWTSFLERIGGVAPDLIGFGRSAKAGNLDYSPKGLTDFLEQFTERVGLDRVALVMHDWGAGPGLAFARRHPQRVSRVVVMNAPPLIEGFDWPWFARLWQRPAIGELAMGATTRWLLARILRSGCATPEVWPDDRIEAVWRQFDQGTQRAILRLYRAARIDGGTLDHKDLQAIRAPALVLWGARDPWLPVTLGEAYAQSLPQAAFEAVEAAGHWPWLDQPPVVDRVARFLA